MFDSGAIDARQGEERSQFAEQLDPELAIHRHEADLLDEAAHGSGRFAPHGLGIECVGQHGDLAAIELGEVRTKAQLWRRRGRQLRFDLAPPPLESQTSSLTEAPSSTT